MDPGNRWDRLAYRAAASLCAAQRGASTVEQALFIALVIGAALAGVEGLSLVSRSTFETVARDIGFGSSTSAEGNDAPAARTNDPKIAADYVDVRNILFSPRLLLLLIACPFGAVCWYLLYRDSRKRGAKELAEEAPPPAATKDEAMFSKRHDLLRIFSGDVGMLFNSRMQIRQVMTRSVTSILPTATLDEVRQLMAEKKIRHLLVCDKSQQLLGVISDRNVHLPTAKCAREMMSTDPVTVEPDSFVSPAVTLLLQRRISCLPVVDGQQVVGIVTSSDLLMAFQCTLHALQRAASEAVANLPAGTLPGFMLTAQGEFLALQSSELSSSATSECPDHGKSIVGAC